MRFIRKTLERGRSRSLYLPLYFLIVGSFCASQYAQAEYPGAIWPEGESVLSGEWQAQFPEPLPMPIAFDNEGFAVDRLSKVPPPGVHPRIFVSPEDIKKLRAELKAEDPDRVLMFNWQVLKNLAANEVPDDFQKSHWDFVSILGARALQALIEEDQATGREVAAKVVEHALYLEPIWDGINKLDRIPDSFYKSRSIQPADNELGFEYGMQQLQHTGLAQEYDYAYNFMTEAQRAIVRRVISKITYGKYASMMEMPPQFSMNNHISLGLNFLWLALAIEGEEGYDPRITEKGMEAFIGQLAWNISPDGMGYEDVKGFMNAYVALAYGRRNPDILKTDRLMAIIEATASRMYNVKNTPDRFGRHGARRTRNTPDVMPELWIADALMARAVVLMHRFYPENKLVDFVYKSHLYTHNYDQDDVSLLEPADVSRHVEFNLFMMREGIHAKDGEPINYNISGLPDAVKELNTSWLDPMRGFAVMRNDWSKDSPLVSYRARNDFYYGGHESADFGDFMLSADGVEWAPYAGAYQNSWFHNMMTIDGTGPTTLAAATARMMSLTDTEGGTTAVSDQSNGFSWTMLHGGYDLKHPMYSDTNHFLFNRHLVFKQNRHTTVPIPERIREFYEGYAHKDYGSWHGENRGVIRYQKRFPIDAYFRTFHYAKGEYPYMLVMDDARVDGKKHQFDWGMHLTEGARLVSMYSKSMASNTRPEPEAPDDQVGTDLLFTYGPGDENPKEGDPMLLVRVLWRNTNFLMPQPSFRLLKYDYPGVWASARAGRVSVPAYSEDPEFRILIYPHRQGDPLPDTAWNEDRSQLKIAIGDQEDRYTFSKSDGGSQADAPAGERVVFVQQRDSQVVARSEAAPPAPRLRSVTTDGVARGFETIGYDYARKVGGGSTRFADSAQLNFEAPSDGRRIDYRINDGEWTLYTGPITVSDSARITARTVPVRWIYGEVEESPLFQWDFEKTEAVQADREAMPLHCRVYEYRKDIYDERGFFTGKDPLIHPDLITSDISDDRIEPIFDGSVEGLYPPATQARLPMEEMAKASYLYTGSFEATSSGVHYFKLNAPGPLYLEINGARIIENLGPHRMDQHDTITSVPLEAGLHSFTLLVTDPVYWKGTMEEPMSFSLSVLRPDSAQPVRYETLHGDQPELQPEVIGQFDAVSLEAKPGFLLEVYNRVGRGSHGDFSVPNNGLESTYFEVAAEAPVHREIASELETNYSLHSLTRYTGFYRVAVPGLYGFKLDPTGCNQVRVHDTLVWQSRVDAAPLGEVAVDLEAGWHPIDLRFAQSGGALMVKTPLAEAFEPVNPVSLAVSANSQVAPLSGDALLKKGLVATGPGVHTNLAMARNVGTVMMWVRQDPEQGKVVQNLFDVEGQNVFATTRIRFGSAVETGHTKAGASIRAYHDIPLGEWYHLAVCQDKEAIKVYVNGERIGKSKFDLPSRNHHYETVTVDPDKIKENAQLAGIRIYNLTPSPELLEAVMQSTDPR